MLHNIAKGDFEILDYYGLRDHLEKKGFLSWLIGPKRKKFNVIWVDGFQRSIDDIINAVLTRRREGEYGPGLLYYLPTEAAQIEVSSKIGFDKVFTSESELKKVFIPEKPKNIKEGFEIAKQQYVDKQTDELLIIIDEFETVMNRADIAQYLKSVKNARFIIIGIAKTTIELIGQHPSIARDIHAIELPSMTYEELRSILDIGSYILTPYCDFADAAKDEIVRLCYGSPYWCHFIAQSLVKQKLELAGSLVQFIDIKSDDLRTIDQKNVISLIKELPHKADTTTFEELFKQITMGNETIAKILLTIAKNPENLISSSLVSTLLQREEGISKDITIKTIEGMLKMTNSPFVEINRILDTFSFSFLDPNFRRYILIRNVGLSVKIEDPPQEHPEMVFVPAGNFLYGSLENDSNAGPDEKPQRTIKLSSFYIDIFLVTNEQFCKFLNEKRPNEYDKWIKLSGGKCKIKKGGDKYTVEYGYERHPVIYVSWYGAQEYAQWVGKRLPTEVEWEKAARGPNGRIFPWGDNFDKNLCNSKESGISEPSRVDRFQEGKSYYGCYDMAGNVQEWTDSWHNNKTLRVLRGGSWNHNEFSCRCASRYGYDPSGLSGLVGFRCVLCLSEKND